MVIEQSIRVTAVCRAPCDRLSKTSRLAAVLVSPHRLRRRDLCARPPRSSRSLAGLWLFARVVAALSSGCMSLASDHRTTSCRSVPFDNKSKCKTRYNERSRFLGRKSLDRHAEFIRVPNTRIPTKTSRFRNRFRNSRLIKTDAGKMKNEIKSWQLLRKQAKERRKRVSTMHT